MAKKRRATELFSISFLDCICCGFGAMLLLFVLLIGRQAASPDSEIAQIKTVVADLPDRIEREKKITGEIRERMMIQQERLAVQISNRDVTKLNLTSLEQELALMLQQRSSLRDEKDRLLGLKDNVPKQDESPPLPIPNTQRRQYLTGFNFEGSYVVFMIEASGGMLGYTVDEAMGRQNISEAEKRQSDKWRRVVRSVQWIIANLGPRQGYQVLIFNNEAKPLLPQRENEWLESMNRDTTIEVIKALDLIVPRGGANLERAFLGVRESFPSVDTVVLLTDGLPTLSDSIAVGSTTDDRDRERFFRAAIKEAPRQTPINAILFPMTGDPAAPYLLWQLADASNGSLISPASSWPDI